MRRLALVQMVVALAVLPIPAAVIAGTIQQDFDTAQSLLDAGNAAAARDAFTALLARLPPASKGKAASLVRARLGNALMATGDAEAAEPLLASAIAGFGSATPQDREERGLALFDLGRAHELQGKLDSAARAYAEVLRIGVFPANAPGDLSLRAALARSLVWSNPDEARRLIDGLLALPAATFGNSNDTRALLQTLRGRVELNNGDAAAARRWFTDAAATAGGAETQKVTVADVRIRGDLALANYKLGKLDEVQKFIAYSGAGSLSAEGLTLARDMPLPACAPATGLAPDAVAIVEFAIGSDGRVSSVTPIYASRGSGTPAAGVPDSIPDGGPESQFVGAVRRWVWNTGDVARLNPFWRQAVRVELRCFTSRGTIDPVAQSFKPDIIAWAKAAGVRAMPALPANDAAALPMLRAELARREAADGAQSVQLVPVLFALVSNDAAPDKERVANDRRLIDLLVAASAPVAVAGNARLLSLFHDASLDSYSAATAARAMRDRLVPLLASIDADGNGETRFAAWVRLVLAQAHDSLRAPDPARALLDRIIAMPETVVPAGDPIRTAALLRLSNIAAAARDSEGAARALAATGLSAEQCSLIDVRPQAINASVGGTAFPNEAIRWGTGGYARVGHDITTDGHTTNVRTIIAAPPFIFGPPTEKAVARFRFQPVLRPGNTIGCSANTQSVRYRIAG